MKLLFISFFLLGTFGLQVNAQDAVQQKQLAGLLDAYYGIKSALTNGNAVDAVFQANEFSAGTNLIDKKVIKEDKLEALKQSADKIAGTKEIDKQRIAFSKLSDDLYAVAKTVKLSMSPIYRQYCPMKKAYWLSSEQEIKNPYYGSMMLSCGKVVETIKP